MARTEKQTTRRLPIGRILLIAFIVMPIIEIGVLIKVGGWLGLWPTLLLIILTAILGTWMLRQQGFAVLTRAQTQLERGAVPLAEVFEGFCLVIAGALLLTPGFVTDLMGGLLLLPPLRLWLYRTVGSHFRSSVTFNEGHLRQETRDPEKEATGHDRPKRTGPGPVVEGDFETVDPDDDPEAERAEPPTSQSDDVGDEKPMPPPRGRWDNKS